MDRLLYFFPESHKLSIKPKNHRITNLHYLEIHFLQHKKRQHGISFGLILLPKRYCQMLWVEHIPWSKCINPPFVLRRPQRPAFEGPEVSTYILVAFPCSLCLQFQFEGYGKGCGSRTSTLSPLRSESHRCEGQFDRIGGPNMDPMHGQKIVERKPSFLNFWFMSCTILIFLALHCSPFDQKHSIGIWDCSMYQ